jgi:ATP-binding cassette subfamily B protein
MKFLFSRLGGFKGKMTVGLIIKILGTVAELFLPVILSHILDDVIAREDVWQIVFYGGVMLLCAGAACGLNVIANRMVADVSMRFSRKLRRDLFDKTLHLSARDIDRFTVSSLEARITSDTYNVHNFVNVMQRMGVRAPMLLIGGITITLIMDSFLALVMIAMLPIIFGIILFIRTKGTPLYERVQKSVDKMVRVVREDVQGIRVIKALSRGEHENRRYDKVNRSLSRDEVRAGTGFVLPTLRNGLTRLDCLWGHSSLCPRIALQAYTFMSMAIRCSPSYWDRSTCWPSDCRPLFGRNHHTYVVGEPNVESRTTRFGPSVGRITWESG